MAVLVACFVGVVVGGTFPPVALAATDGQCNGYWLTEATRTNGLSYADRGVRANGADHVYGGGDQCSHVDSVAVAPGSTDFVESGWGTVRTAYNTWNPNNNCNASGETNHPEAFYGWRVGSTLGCVLSTTISVNGGDNPTASVYQDSQPFEWVVNFSNGSGNGFTHVLSGMGFSTGAPLTNCDRHWKDPGDPTIEKCDAHFTGMQYRNGVGNYVDWGSEVCYNNTTNQDPTYDNHLTQPAEVTVEVGGANC